MRAYPRVSFRPQFFAATAYLVESCGENSQTSLMRIIRAPATGRFRGLAVAPSHARILQSFPRWRILAATTETGSSYGENRTLVVMRIMRAEPKDGALVASCAHHAAAPDYHDVTCCLDGWRLLYHMYI